MRRLPSGHWQARIQVDGQRAAATWTTREQAQQWATVTRARLTGQVAPAVTVAAYVPVWLATYDTGPANTRRFYARATRPVVAALGDRPLDQVRPGEIGRLLADVHHASGIAAVERTYRALSVLFHAAVADGLADRTPVISCRHRPRRQRRPQPVLEYGQARAVLARLAGWQADTALLQLALGARFGEIAGLTALDLDPQRGTVAIRRRYSGHVDTIRSTKTYRHRTLRLPDVTVTTVRRLCAAAPATAPLPDLDGRELPAAGYHGGWLIRTRTGRPANLSAFNKALKTACLAAGAPPISSHGLRHTFVSWMIDAGHTAEQIGWWIGDSPQTVATVYAHMLAASSDPAAATIDAALTPAMSVRGQAVAISEVAGGGPGRPVE